MLEKLRNRKFNGWHKQCRRLSKCQQDMLQAKIKYVASIENQICGSLSHVLGSYSLIDKRINQPKKIIERNRQM